MMHSCSYCKGVFCDEHRIPEKHECDAQAITQTVHEKLSQSDAEGIEEPESMTDVSARSAPSESVGGDSTPDVNPDGSLSKIGADDETDQSKDDQSQSRMKLALTGATAGKRYQGDCPNCGHWVSKRGTDRYTICHRCGWKAGLPVIRLFTHYPRWIKIKRSAKLWTKRAVVFSVGLLIGAFLISATVGTGYDSIDDPTDNIVSSSGVAVDNSTESGSGSSVVSGINETKTERLIHQEINQRRQSHGLARLDYDGDLASIAEGHSGDMAQDGYFSHESPEGHGIEYRYQEAGYECRIDVGQRYLTGGENIAQTYVFTELATEGGESYLDSEEELARSVVNQWMNSTGHRENILTPEFRNEGLGVVITEDDTVYATQNFC
jgi:uncharacterized protein YkwD